MGEWLTDLHLDLRFAARAFSKRPGFTAVAVLTLALGIGATTAVFSIVDAVLLRPLPYRDPARLVAIWVGSAREKALAPLFDAHADYIEYRAHSRTLASVGATTWAGVSSPVLTGHGPARTVLAFPATVSFFETLGVPAALGRTFLHEDEARGCSVMLSYGFWKTLGGDPSIVGKNLDLDEKPCNVAGVMPESFSFYPRAAKAWTLMGPESASNPQRPVWITARLKPGVTAAQAEAELKSLYRAIHTRADEQDFEPQVRDLHDGFTFLAGRTLQRTLILIFAAVLLVLLTACLNVGNLLLARVSDRRRELALRAALGSGQSRLVRQVLSEGLLLASGSALLGVVLAWGAVAYFSRVSPIELTVGADAKLNLPVLAFGIALSFATSLLFALLPAIRGSHVDLARDLRTSGRGAIRGRQRLAKTVVAVEMALSFLLLIGAGLFMTSAFRMGTEPLGFQPEGAVIGYLSLPSFRYSTDPQRIALYDRVLEKLQKLPDVTGAALASLVPPHFRGFSPIEIPGRPVAPGHEVHDVGTDAVSPQFFDALQIPLRRGRTFTAQDRDKSQPVAIVNQALAEEYFPGVDPVGRQLRFPNGKEWFTVVGVVGNVKQTDLLNEMSWVESPILYRPLAQDPRNSLQVMVRTRGGGSVVTALEREIASVDPVIPLSEAEPIPSKLAKTLAYPRFRAAVLAFFALGALLLSAVGLYGVLSQLVAQRIAEFGLRRAVGAQTHDLLLLVARQGGIPVLAGLAAGLWASSALSRVLANLLYGIQAADPRALGVVSAVLLAVSGLAMLRPAIRAARVDPMAALRED